MIIAKAGVDDAEAVAALVNRAYRGTEAMRGWTHEAGLLDGQRTDAAMVGAVIAKPPGALLLLLDATGGAPRGCVAIAPTSDPAVWSLGMLTVDPDHQAGGSGRRLIRAAEGYAADHGAHRVSMTVIASRATLIAWYERCGYRRTGAVAPFPYGDARFGRPLRDDLSFIVLEKPCGASGDVAWT